VDYIGEKLGCYKVGFDFFKLGPISRRKITDMIVKNILDCSPEKEAFYEKCGYEKRGTEMHRYFDAESVEHGV